MKSLNIIDLAALEHNFRQALAHAPKEAGILAMVKADAYGHGALPVAKRLSQCGTAAFGVARVEEGIELRTGGIQEPILVMGGLWGEGEKAAALFVEHALTPVVHSAEVLPILAKAGVQKFHLKIDTGMTRMGLRPEGLASLLKTLKRFSGLQLEGVMTHLAWRENPAYTSQQYNLFIEAAKQITPLLSRDYHREAPIWHIANSAATMAGEPIVPPFSGKVWLRPGTMLYGIPPYPNWVGTERLKPVMAIVSGIGLLKTVPAGTKVSYNCTFETNRKSRLAVVPIGYADGYPWNLENKAQVLIGGERCPVVGRVTMDMIVVDVTEAANVHVGDEVVLLGKQGKNAITADMLAAWAQTIPYEIVCRVSRRLKREYRG